MRLTRIAATTLIAGSLALAGTGVALADTVTPVTNSSAVSVVSEPGVLTLSASSVKPGAQVTFSGTFAEPAASTATGPITVTSPAFAGPATLSRSNPEAFDGSATIASGAHAGTYTVTASSSAGTVTSRITVVGTVPPPVPAHHSTAAGTHTAGHHTTAEESTDTTSTDAVSATPVDPASGPDLLPWVLGGTGLVVLAGGGAYALGRGRRSVPAAPRREDDREPRTEVMTRR
ncbi:hypothetical protein [Actinomycetospora sp. NBRC 106378]|uniref:hypothetical protein n=1 Tax=Actinomycetospora sp. NBRC 106378 TaxID=3032208 RepID=UPI0024A5FD07|nr:hypothetical protein [Actinomycetospora sp. NBRC 106378]GLZ51752.1 hypothetical protein Acsp07_13690 [Actinomycetospora sp. NBRC 106378]